MKGRSRQRSKGKASTGRIWTPAEITTIAWYDASDASSITESSGSVSQWDDIGTSGTLHLTQGTGAAQPLTGSRTLNGLNTLDFDAAQFMLKSGFPVDASGDISIFIVAEIDLINDSADSLFSMDATNDFQFDSSSASVYNPRINGAGIGAIANASSPPYAGPSIYNTVFDFAGVAKYLIFIDGEDKTAGGTSYTTKLDASQVFRVCTNRAAYATPEGGVGEVIVLTDVTSVNRQLIEGYLAWKWGLQANLPSSHPYRYSPPTI